MFTPDPMFASAFGITPSAPAQAPPLTPAQVAAKVAAATAPKAAATGAPKFPPIGPPKVPAMAALKVAATASPKVAAMVAPKPAAEPAFFPPYQVAIDELGLDEATMDPALVAIKIWNHKLGENETRAQFSAKLASMVAPETPVQVAPVAPALVGSQVGTMPQTQVAAKHSVQDRAVDAKAKEDAEAAASENKKSRKCDDEELERIIREMEEEDARHKKRQAELAEIMAKKRALAQVATSVPVQVSSNVPAQVVTSVPVQASPKVPAQVSIVPPTKAPTLAASTGYQGPLKPLAVRGVKPLELQVRAPQQPTSHQGHNGVSDTQFNPPAVQSPSAIPEKPVSHPGNDGVSTAQVKLPPADSYPGNTSSMIGNQSASRSAEALRHNATSRSVMPNAPIVDYYQDQNFRAAINLPETPSVAPAQPQPTVNSPKTPDDNAPVIAYYQSPSYDANAKTSALAVAPVATSVAQPPPQVIYYQSEPTQPKPKISTPAPVASNAVPAPTIIYYQSESPQPKPKRETPAIAINQADASLSNPTPRADMMDTSPGKPQMITANQSGNILQNHFGHSSAANNQPTVNYYQDDYNRSYTSQVLANRFANPSTRTVTPRQTGGAGGQASDDGRLMDLDAQPVTGHQCACPRQSVAGLMTSRWSNSAVEEAGPNSVLCPVHHPVPRVARLTPTTHSLSPTAVCFSPTASSFSPTDSHVPLSEITQFSPDDPPAVSASASIRGGNAESVLNGHSNDGTLRSVRGPRDPNSPWLL